MKKGGGRRALDRSAETNANAGPLPAFPRPGADGPCLPLPIAAGSVRAFNLFSFNSMNTLSPAFLVYFWCLGR
jgi:hypothetical protein